jgi:hypothetical protein
MKTVIVAELAILMAASACGNARGSTTDPGSTFAYSSRQQVKCNTVTMQPDSRQVEAACTSAEDLPLAGGCSNPGPGGGDAILRVNHPGAWEGSGGMAAGWVCKWTVADQAVYVPNAEAWMCCVVKSQ